MSNDSNTELMELAHDHITYWKIGYWPTSINKAIEDNDLKLLEELLILSAKDIASKVEINKEISRV